MIRIANTPRKFPSIFVAVTRIVVPRFSKRLPQPRNLENIFRVFGIGKRYGIAFPSGHFPIDRRHGGFFIFSKGYKVGKVQFEFFLFSAHTISTFDSNNFLQPFDYYVKSSFLNSDRFEHRRTEGKNWTTKRKECTTFYVIFHEFYVSEHETRETLLTFEEHLRLYRIVRGEEERVTLREE